MRSIPSPAGRRAQLSIPLGTRPEGAYFIALVTLHIPPKGKQLVRRYGIYSSRGRGTWKDRPALRNRAPERWYGRAPPDPAAGGMRGQATAAEPLDEPVEVGAAARKKAWARLLAKIYGVNPSRANRLGDSRRERRSLSRLPELRGHDVGDRGDPGSGGDQEDRPVPRG